jgi:hypothetical protein
VSLDFRVASHSHEFTFLPLSKRFATTFSPHASRCDGHTEISFNAHISSFDLSGVIAECLWFQKKPLTNLRARTMLVGTVLEKSQSLPSKTLD